MGQSRLSNLGILHSIEHERSCVINLDDAIRTFSVSAECHGRRLQL